MRHGHGAPEKSKDFFGSIFRIFGELDKYRILLILSLFLAALGSILTIILPGQLSKLTDTITSGISVNQHNLEIVMTNSRRVVDPNEIINDESINEDDKNQYIELLFNNSIY